MKVYNIASQMLFARAQKPASQECQGLANLEKQVPGAFPSAILRLGNLLSSCSTFRMSSESHPYRVGKLHVLLSEDWNASTARMASCEPLI